jgi:hypothetical protein
MLKNLIIALISSFSFNCTEQTIIMKIYFFDSGTRSDINIKEINPKEAENIIKELVAGTSEIMRSYVDEESLNEIRSKESALEIFFNDFLQVNSDEFGELKFKKIFIPLTGDYSGTEESPVASIFIGEEEYLSNPFRNPEGFRLVKKLLKNIFLSND